MKPLLFILGILAAIVFIEKPADAQSGGWCAYLNGGGHDGSRECGFATLQQCLATVRGVAETARLVRIMSRRVTPPVSTGLSLLIGLRLPMQQLRQLGNIRRDPPRLDAPPKRQDDCG